MIRRIVKRSCCSAAPFSETLCDNAYFLELFEVVLLPSHTCRPFLPTMMLAPSRQYFGHLPKWDGNYLARHVLRLSSAAESLSRL